MNTPPPSYTKELASGTSSLEKGPPPPSEDGPAASEKAGRSSDTAERTINVLLIGETANGKSTLIKRLSTYCGKPELEIGIGNGNVSCTREVGTYLLSTNLPSYSLLDPDGKEITGVPSSDLMDYTDDEAVAVVNDPEDGAKLFKFELIDTPGLNDSQGRDMEIMADIIGRVSELSHLNAVIYVRSILNPFGHSFVQLYDYMSRCMPTLFKGLIICHTYYTTDYVDEALSAGRNLAEDRKASFRDATGCAASLAHFFMDNEPYSGGPYGVVQSFNSCRALLELLSAQLPLSVSKLQLLKTPKMLNKDAHILLALTRLQKGLKDRLAKELAAVSGAKQEALRTRCEIDRLKTKLASVQEELEEANTDSEIVLGTKTVAEEYTLETLLGDAQLWLDKRVVSFDSDCTITRVSKSVGKNCRWLDEDLRGTSWRAKLHSRILRSMNGSATFYTTSRLKHKAEIVQFKSSIKELKQTISYHKQTLERMASVEEMDAATQKISNAVNRCDTLINTVERDTFDGHLWPILRQFYRIGDSPSLTDMIDFVKVYDPEIAGMMGGI